MPTKTLCPKCHGAKGLVIAATVEALVRNPLQVLALETAILVAEVVAAPARSTVNLNPPAFEVA